MNTSDLSLVVFTVLAQMSVGAFLLLGAVHFFAARSAGVEEADKMSDRALLPIGVVLVAGFIASLLHLGTPLNAPRALTHLGSSWLSREILFGVLFAVGGFLFAILQWRKILSPTIRNLIAIITGLLGLGLVYTMSMVYFSLPAVPGWNTLATPVGFFATTFLLGALSIGVAFVANYAYLKRKSDPALETQLRLLNGSLRWLSLVAIVMAGVHFVITPLFAASLAVTDTPAAQQTANMLLGDFGPLFALRMALVFVGAGVLGLFLYQNAVRQDRVRAVSLLAYTAFVTVLASELVARFLFYATYARDGLM
ncbi:MAG: dimethyl sulfoxide reductase anchor subunit [Chloroflexi bacterium]|nr:dimethyl sulfoxide reductase anchor subunit [Chloroflexota bacterium]